MAEEVHLTKSDRIKVWWRSTFIQGSWNYERMQNGLHPDSGTETFVSYQGRPFRCFETASRIL